MSLKMCSLCYAYVYIFLDFLVFVLLMFFFQRVSGVWLIFLGGATGILVLLLFSYLWLGLSFFGGFYVFVGGVLCVCGFFATFFWNRGVGFVMFWLIVPCCFIDWVLLGFKFAGSGLGDVFTGWILFQPELFMRVFCVLLSMVCILLFVQGQSGRIRAFDI